MAISTASTAAIAVVEAAIGRALAMDPTTTEKIGMLAGKVFHLSCELPELDLYVLPRRQGLNLSGSYEDEVTCRVRGKASEFIEVFTSADKGAALINSALRVDGDTSALQQLQETLSALELDWEAQLATLIGDIPAHGFGKAMRDSIRWGRNAGNSLHRQLEEFIHEEARVAPSREEVEEHAKQIKTIESRLKRARTSMKRLQRRIRQTGET